MRVLLLSQWFQPEPFLKGLPLAKALRDRGHDVEVLTGFPNYPGGKVYPGYRVRPWRRETIEGIPVIRTVLYPSHDRSGVRRMANYLSFGVSTGVLAPWLVRRPDVIYLYNLVTLMPAARLLRVLRGSKIVLDVQDLWPESVGGSGMLRNRFLLRALEYFCKIAYHSADRVIVLSPGFRDALVSRGVPAERVEVVYNWCDEAAMQPRAPDPSLAGRINFAGRFNIVFAGTMGHMQALDAVVESARQLRQRLPQVLFTFIGGGIDVERLKSLVEDLPNVQFLARMPPEDISRVYAIADALLVHLKDDPLFEITIPSKIQAYLFAGRPILCGVKGDAAEMVRRAHAGITFLPENPSSLTQAVMEMHHLAPAVRQELGENGRRYYDEHLCLPQGVAHIDRVLNDTLRGVRIPDATSSGSRPH